ncbi:MAG: ATP-grasp domain-containing protein [Lachnospiraceae bacterium]|nr:ATP-grasp domain-containing protein [Lachnospiraceae bacterium]
MNILVLSAGTRNLVLRAFKENLAEGDKLIASDCSHYAPALYEVDEYALIPRMDSPKYLEAVFELCENKKADAVFSLIDPELSVLAKHKERLLSSGTTPIVSPYELVETCLHKWQTKMLFEKNGLSTINTYTTLADFNKALEAGEVEFPVFVKPEDGSASLNINVARDFEEVSVLFKHYDHLIIQEHMGEKQAEKNAPGIEASYEIGADCYIDMLSGECVSIFTKKKLKMRAGETDKSVSFKDEKLFELIKGFVQNAGFRGMIDIDIFKRGEEYVFSEVNPRFGGGYPHAYACGANFPKLLMTNMKGEANPAAIGDYEEGIVMMKYSDIVIKSNL